MMLKKFFTFSWRRMMAIMHKELLQLRRERSTFLMIIASPIVQLILVGYAVDMNPHHLPTYVLCRDQSSFARSFVAGLKNSDYFEIKGDVSSDAEGKLFLQQGKAQFVVTIPEFFERDLIKGKQPTILIEGDATDPVAVSGPVAAMDGILQRVLAHDLKGPLAYLNPSPSPVQVVLHRLYNPDIITAYNIIPGLLGVVITMTGVMMVSLALTRESERGTMENLLVMPSLPLEIMIGKIVPYIFIGYIQSAIVVALAWYMFSIPIIGNMFLLFFAMGIFIACNLAMGFTMATIAGTQMAAMQGTILITIPSFMLSGFIFPFLGMPLWARVIGYFLPMTWFNNIVRGIILKGNGLAEVWPDVWPLLIIMVCLMIIATNRYKKTL